MSDKEKKLYVPYNENTSMIYEALSSVAMEIVGVNDNGIINNDKNEALYYDSHSNPI